MEHVEHGNMQRDERDEWPANEPIGSFDIELGTVEGYPGATAHILFVCPNNRRCAALIGPAAVGRPEEGKLCIWGWNGDRDRPTLTPSLNCRDKKDDGSPAGGCGWHGFITNGVMK